MTEWRLRVSGYDKQVHAFLPEQPAATWAAACSHSAPVSFLAECPDDCPTCVQCLIKFGDTVATRQENQMPAIRAGLQEQFAAFGGDKP